MSENWLPNPVANNNPFNYAWNKLVDWCRRNTLKSSDEILVNQTTHGTTLSLRKRIAYGGAGGAGGTSTGLNWRGNYNPTATYNTNDLVVTGAGVSAGAYVSLINNNTNAADSGIGWVQFPSSGLWL